MNQSYNQGWKQCRIDINRKILQGQGQLKVGTNFWLESGFPPLVIDECKTLSCIAYFSSGPSLEKCSQLRNLNSLGVFSYNILWLYIYSFEVLLPGCSIEVEQSVLSANKIATVTAIHSSDIVFHCPWKYFLHVFKQRCSFDEEMTYCIDIVTHLAFYPWTQNKTKTFLFSIACIWALSHHILKHILIFSTYFPHNYSQKGMILACISMISQVRYVSYNSVTRPLIPYNIYDNHAQTI